MDKYLATIRVEGKHVRTVVFADSSLHARLLLQYQFGIHSFVKNPTLAAQQSEGMNLVDSTIKSIKPMTPAQARVNGLKKGIERGRQALQAEKDFQRRQRENQRKLKQAHSVSPSTG